MGRVLDVVVKGRRARFTDEIGHVRPLRSPEPWKEREKFSDLWGSARTAAEPLRALAEVDGFRCHLHPGSSWSGRSRRALQGFKAAITAAIVAGEVPSLGGIANRVSTTLLAAGERMVHLPGLAPTRQGGVGG